MNSNAEGRLLSRTPAQYEGDVVGRGITPSLQHWPGLVPHLPLSP